MSIFSLPADDVPSSLTHQDQIWHQQLEEAIARCFYESCDGVLQALLMACDWHLSLTSGELTLYLTCHDLSTNWRVLHNTRPIGRQLSRFTPNARIRVQADIEMGIPIDLHINELPL